MSGDLHEKVTFAGIANRFAETTNIPIYHFRNGRFSVLHHFENRRSHYPTVSTGSNSSFPGIRGFGYSLAPIRSTAEASNTFARDETWNAVIRWCLLID